MSKNIEMTEGQFDAAYPLVANHLNLDAAWDGCLFNPDGEENAFVRKQDSRTVWTLIDNDGAQEIHSGYWNVNRIGHLISAKRFPKDADIMVAVE